MDVDQALAVIERTLLSRQLNPTERFVLRQSWDGKTYDEMAQGCNYGSVYIKEIGSQLWHDLSEVMGERVTKKNLHLIINHHQKIRTGERQIRLTQKLQTEQADERESNLVTTLQTEPPGAPLPVDSPLYINRSGIEERAYSGISQPGGLVLIKAPTKMGKSSLLNRVIAQAKSQRYETVYLDLREADEAVFQSLDKFLRWFSVNISRQLKLNPRLDDYWDEEMGSKVSCKLYFEAYLLEQLDSPLLLAVNEINQVFEHSNIAQEFLSMLRYWHEQAKQVEIWQKLRMVLVQTTEIYIPLKLNQSPFNVGVPILMPPFTLKQVQDLARRYGLNWGSDRSGAQCLAPLVTMVGGHPYLINIALYHLHQQTMTLEELLQSAPTQAGIYGDYLRSLLALLQEQAELALALRQVVSAKEGVPLEAITAYKLESLGVIKLDGNQAIASCELYRLYFLQQLGEINGLKSVTSSALTSNQICSSKHLPQVTGNGSLNTVQGVNSDISIIGNLTQLATWEYLNEYLETNWQQWAREMTVLSLIICEVDYFNFYTKAYGQLAADACMRRITSTINDCVRYQAILFAKYGETKFAALMPHTDAIVAVEIAQVIREQVKALGLAHDQSRVGGFPSQFVTVSVGVASNTPTGQSSPNILIDAAIEALFQSKRKGRDRVTFCE